jgi:uncharacterized protein (DUF2141 family)
MAMRCNRIHSPRGTLVLLLGLAAARVAAQETEATTVSIGGEVRFEKAAPVFLKLLALDASGKEFVARERVIALTAEDVTRRRLRFEFAGLAPGRYALQAFQDVNGNGKIDIGIFGPKEPWATYRLAQPRFRPPRFEEMAFDARTSVTDANLVMR